MRSFSATTARRSAFISVVNIAENKAFIVDRDVHNNPEIPRGYPKHFGDIAGDYKEILKDYETGKNRGISGGVLLNSNGGILR